MVELNQNENLPLNVGMIPTVRNGFLLKLRSRLPSPLTLLQEYSFHKDFPLRVPPVARLARRRLVGNEL